MAFGQTFSIDDPQFWRAIQKSAEKVIEDSQEPISVLMLVTQLKQAGILSNKALRKVAKIANDPPKDDIESLAILTQIYLSPEM